MPLHKTVTYYIFLHNSRGKHRATLELLSSTLESVREEYRRLPISLELIDNSVIRGKVVPFNAPACKIAASKCRTTSSWIDIDISDIRAEKKLALLQASTTAQEIRQQICRNYVKKETI